MNNMIEELWAQFAVETQEHIDEIELKLVEADQSGSTPELVAALFRAFHSLKGLAGIMELRPFARVAHRAEDILGVIRTGDFPLNGDVISLLLAALDELKKLRQGSVASHTSVEADPGLIEYLESTISSIEQNRKTDVTPPADTVALTPGPIRADKDMLAYFIELAREKNAAIFNLLEPIFTTDGPIHLDDHAGAIGRSIGVIDELIFAAHAMEFNKLEETLSELRSDLLAQEHGYPEEAVSTITLHLLELHDQIRYLESNSGNSDAGSESLHSILTDVMHITIQRRFATVLEQLDMLQLAENESDNQTRCAHALQSALSSLNSHLSFFMNSTTCSTILMLEDVFSRGARGELHIFGELIDLARAEVIHVRDNFQRCAAGDGICECESDTQRVQRFHDYIWAYESGCGTGNPIDVFRQFMAGLNIEPELLRVLSPENVRDLMQAMKDGEHIYEVMAHLETDEEMTATFLAWIESSKSRIITNRSIFIEERSWYEMLMVSTLTRSEIAENLTQLDPTGISIRLKSGFEELPPKDDLLKVLNEIPEPQRHEQTHADTSGSVIRVQGSVLEGFMSLIGEMVLTRSRLNHLIHDDLLSRMISRLRQGGDTDELAAELLELVDEHRHELLETDQALHNALGRLQESAMSLRVVPVEQLFRRLPRVIRDLARQQEKQVRLVMTGQDVRIDKAMVEILTDPLLHLVRNCVDHGIESPDLRSSTGKPREAVIRVAAIQRGNSIVMEISDDGGGIRSENLIRRVVEEGLASRESCESLSRDELLRFIFHPGFSTSTNVTETSGRGVGMDVVMTNVLRMGGDVAVDSVPGRGTTFTLRMPLSAAIQDVLMVESSGCTMALPGRYVSEVLEIGDDELQTVCGDEAILLRGSFLPLHSLSRLLGYPESAATPGGIAVVLTNGSRTIGLKVDRVLRRQELFVKDIQESLAALPGVGGASILGNGRVVLILDGEELLRMSLSGAARV
ncbi:MAG: chemotaxis protein CheA [Desulfuromonadales bacterium]